MGNLTKALKSAVGGKAKKGSPEAKAKSSPKISLGEKPVETAKGSEKNPAAKHGAKNGGAGAKNNLSMAKEKKTAASQKTAAKKAGAKKNLPKKPAAKKANPEETNQLKMSQKKTGFGKKESEKAGKKTAAPQKSRPVQKAPAARPKKQNEGSGNFLKNRMNFYEKELEKILNQEKEERRIVKDMEGRRYCVVGNCDFPAIVEDYCRLHYFAHWDYIMERKKLLEERFFEKAISALAEKYSDGALEFLLKDLVSEKNFAAVVKKLLEEEDQSESAGEEGAFA